MHDLIAAGCVGWVAGTLLGKLAVALLGRVSDERWRAIGKALDASDAAISDAAEASILWFLTGCQTLSWAILQGKDPFRIR